MYPKTITKDDYDITSYTLKKNDQLPVKNANAFRKRPTDLQYDPNEFHSFLLPSEKMLTYSVFDVKDVFGKRKNSRHSPYVRTQLDLDTNILIAWFLATMLMWFTQLKAQDKYENLRESFLNSDMGRFEREDFL